MRRAVKRNLSATRVAAGEVTWTSAAGSNLANPSFTVGGDFFRATADDQVSLLVQHLAGATRNVEAAFIPAYVALAEWIHRHA
jgi:hypothetical protein